MHYVFLFMGVTRGFLLKYHFSNNLIFLPHLILTLTLNLVFCTTNQFFSNTFYLKCFVLNTNFTNFTIKVFF